MMKSLQVGKSRLAFVSRTEILTFAKRLPGGSVMIWIFSLAVFLSAPSFAMATSLGPGSGGGGDAYALEFTSLGQKIIAEIHRNESLRALLDSGEYGSTITSLFEDKVRDSTVETKDHVLFDDREVDATNDPKRSHIDLSRSRWPRLTISLGHQAALVLHEYLGLIGVYDKYYEISGPFFQWQQQHGFPFETVAPAERSPRLYRVVNTITVTKSDEYSQLMVLCADGDRALLGNCTLPFGNSTEVDHETTFSYGIYNANRRQYLINERMVDGFGCSLRPPEAFAQGTWFDQLHWLKVTYLAEVLCEAVL
jgi:hypothetical protein